MVIDDVRARFLEEAEYATRNELFALEDRIDHANELAQAEKKKAEEEAAENA